MTTQLTENQKHDFCRETLHAKKDIEFRFIELGRMLHRIKEERLFEAGWGSWEEYTMELKLPASTISRLIRIYEVFVLRFEVKPVALAQAGGWSVIAEYLPLVKKETTKEQVSGWLHGCAQMTRTDVRRSITEEKTGVEMARCAHKDTYMLKVCRDCDDKWQVHE